MFDIGFWELSVIGVIGLLVLGPERLPKVARVAGGYLRKARSTWANVRAEISAELNAEEFKEAMKKPAEEFKSAMAEPMKDLESLKKTASDTISPDKPDSNRSAPEEPAEPETADESPPAGPTSAETDTDTNSRTSARLSQDDPESDKTA